MSRRILCTLLRPLGALAAGLVLAPSLAARPAAAAGDVREVTSLRLLEAPAAWVIALILVPAVLLLVALLYRREDSHVPLRARVACGGLRVLAFFALFLILFRPVRETQPVVIEKSVVPVLLDGSASMMRKDAYADAEVATRLASISGLAGPDQVAETARVDLVRAILERPATDPAQVLGARNEVRWYAFGEELRSLAGPGELLAQGQSTRLGSALPDVLAEVASRGDRVTDVVVISDGRSNSGLDPREAAAIAALDGVRLHTVGVGDPNEPKNVELKSVRAPDVALVNDDVAFEVLLAAKGYEGRLTSLMLETKEGELLASREVTLAGLGREQTEVLFWRPEREGEYDLEVSVQVLPGEQFTDDNRSSHHLRVDPEQIRVIYVEGYPRWEYRYLKNTLLRAKNVQVQCLLVDADKDFIQESSDGVPSLKAFPPERKQLLEYDVVILGDVNPWSLRPTVEESEQALRNIRELVELGGGLIMIAGELENPRSFAGTPLEDVLPVVLGDAEEERRLNRGGLEQPFRPRLENPLDPHEIVRLEKDLAKNRQLWEDPDYGLPPQEWYYPVKKAKGGAEVLLRHPENGNQFGRHVLLATTFYPSGRSLFLAFDSTWLWRKFYVDRYTERFWRAAVRYVALNKLRRTNKRFDLVTDKSLYDVNEPILLTARVRDPDFNPLRDERLPVHLLFPDGREEQIELSNVDPDEGRFEGTIRTGEPGTFQAWLEDPTGREPGRLSPKSFLVQVPSHEWQNPVLARDVLEAMAVATRGSYHGLDELGAALDAVGGDVRERKRGEPEREELWSSWPVLLAFVALLAAEWILRKRYNLI